MAQCESGATCVAPLDIISGPGKSQKARILIVDDETHILRLLRSILARETSYEVVEATNAATALELIAEKAPDLILTDVVMPEKDGFDLCKEIKQQLQTRFVPVVMVTGLNKREYRIRGLEAGADDFLTKPFDVVELLTRVKSLLRMKRLHDEVEYKNNLLNEVLTSYVSQEVSATILSNPEKYLQLGGETRIITVLFADIRGFTEFSERHDAGHVVTVLNQFFSEMVQVVYRNKGTFDKFMGDCLMAFYGAPVSYQDDAARAVQTAVELQQTFRELAKDLLKDPQDALGLGIGINTGEVIVGNVGSRKFMDYTVMGHAVNIAKRLESAAGNGQVMVSEATLAQLNGAFGVQPVANEYLQTTLRLRGLYEIVY